MRDHSPEHATAIDIKRLGPADEALVAAASSIFAREPDAGAVRALLASDSDHLLFAMLDGHPAGFGRAHELRSVEAPGVSFVVTEIRVAPEVRRQGVGHAIILALKELARERGAATMIVITDLAHPAPDGLYASTGGVQAPRRNLVYEYDLTRGSR